MGCGRIQSRVTTKCLHVPKTKRQAETNVKGIVYARTWRPIFSHLENKLVCTFILARRYQFNHLSAAGNANYKESDMKHSHTPTGFC